MGLRNWRLVGVVATVGSLVLTGCFGFPDAQDPSEANESKAPASKSISNCGRDVKIKPYNKVVTLNQAATEVVLALGLESKLFGTAYMDAEIPDKWKAAYESVPALAENYPDQQTLLATKPELVMASYEEAFTDKGVGAREVLAEKGAESYLDPFACPNGMPSAEASFDSVYEELANVAALLGTPGAADKLIAESKAKLEKVEAKAAGKGKKILWFHAGRKTLHVGAGGGGPQIIMDAVGATNIFADLKGGWAFASWDKVVEANPDVIVLAEANWSTSAGKIKYLESNPVLKKLDAVKNKKYVIIDFPETTPGARLVDGAVRLSDELSS